MKANPGGTIDPKFVIGRDRLIQSIWEALEQQSVRINAERRIGKTSVIRKMKAEPADGWFPVFQDLERIHSPEEFAREVYDTVQHFLGRWRRTANRATQFLENSKIGIGGHSWETKKRRYWKELLVTSVEDLVTEKTEDRLVLFWDEVPYMIDNIRKRDGEPIAAEVLDTLRSLRQTHPDFRMVFTGSIGLHHVLSTLHDARLATAPVNDMRSIEVTPLTPMDAQQLAAMLIEGETLSTSDIDAAAETIARETDGFPFYIHHIVSYLNQEQCPATLDMIEGVVTRLLVDADDPLELSHFRTRIDVYYHEPKDAELVRLVLDGLAPDATPASVNELLSRINAMSGEHDDRERLLKMLRPMERDHYLSRTSDGEYQFRFSLIRRWWKLDRGL